MALAADRDLIARQYTNGFREVFEKGVPLVQQGLAVAGALEEAILFAYLCFLRDNLDTLIVRKRNAAEAREASRRAGEVLAQGWPHTKTGWSAFADFDAWLRAEGNGRNPGATADLIAAALFVLLRQGTIFLPSPYPWTLQQKAKGKR